MFPSLTYGFWLTISKVVFSWNSPFVGYFSFSFSIVFVFVYYPCSKGILLLVLFVLL